MTVYNEIVSTETDAGSPIDELLEDTGNRLNLKSHEERIKVLEAGGGDPSTGWLIYDDFSTTSAQTDNYGDTRFNGVLGGGSIAGDTSVSDANHPGIYAITSAGATNTTSLARYTQQMQLGGGAMTIEYLIYIPTLSTGAQTYQILLSVGTDSLADSTINNGIYFFYDQASHANWRCVTKNGGVSTVNTTSQLVNAGRWIKLRMVINSGATQVDFYIGENGAALTNVATITTNIPTGLLIPHVNSIKKTVGATGMKYLIDYFKASQTFTTAR